MSGRIWLAAFGRLGSVMAATAGGGGPMFWASDHGSPLDAVFGIAKAVAMLTQRGEIERSGSTATGIARRAAC